MNEEFQILPLTADNWDDLLTIFGESGGYGHCWCVYWRLSYTKYLNSSHNERRILLKTITETEVFTSGVIGYVGGQPATWSGFSPRKSFERLNKSRVILPIDDKEVWSIVCFFFKKEFRGLNLIDKHIKGIIEYSKNNGIKIIETYPIELEKEERQEGRPIWYGTRSIFEKMGFKKVGTTKSKDGGKSRIIMRYYQETKTEPNYNDKQR